MALSDTVRSAVATAAKAAGALLCDVEHSAVSSTDAFDKPTYAAAAVVPALVLYRTKVIRRDDGTEAVAFATVYFLRDIAIDARDKIELPDGRTGPILAIGGLVDPKTGRPYLSEVALGS